MACHGAVMNSLVGVTTATGGGGGSWIGDRPDGGTVAVVASSSDNRDDLVVVVEAESSSKGTPFNIIYSFGGGGSTTTTAVMFFEAEILELGDDDEASAAAVAVGVVRDDEFAAASGWKVRGMFYNGNVTNGGAALIVGFGDYLEAGHKVGVLLRQRPKAEQQGLYEIEAVFYLNGRCLGTAFRLEEDLRNDGGRQRGNWRPCIHLSGRVKFAFRAPEALPETTRRQPPPSTANSTSPYAGDWKLKQLLVGPELSEFPLPAYGDDAPGGRRGEGIILSFKETAQKQFRLSVKVSNSLSCNVQVVGKDESHDFIRVVGPIASTMMMPPPELREVEDIIRSESSLPGLQRMALSTNKLVLTGPTAEFVCERYLKHFEPRTSYA